MNILSSIDKIDKNDVVKIYFCFMNFLKLQLCAKCVFCRPSLMSLALALLVTLLEGLYLLAIA